jgi:hypothetical protein
MPTYAWLREVLCGLDVKRIQVLRMPSVINLLIECGNVKMWFVILGGL